MIMKKLFFILVAFFASSFSLAQDYPFSVVKSGTGKQAIVFIPALPVREMYGRKVLKC